jgi:hypothetical protein
MVAKSGAARCAADRTNAPTLGKDTISGGILPAINRTRGATLGQFIEDAAGNARQSRGLLGATA